MFNSLDHHAYAVVGNLESSLRAVTDALVSCGETILGNPDCRVERYPLFGIDEARALILAASRASVSGGRKVFVVAADKLTHEAQNALLKVFEEPTPQTHFFLVIREREMIIPTLSSRLLFLFPPAPAQSEEGVRAREFLKAPRATRIGMVQKLLKTLEDDVDGRARILAFLDAIEGAVAEKGSTASSTALAAILSVKRYSRDRAPSFKILLEHLALVL